MCHVLILVQPFDSRLRDTEHRYGMLTGLLWSNNLDILLTCHHCFFVHEGVAMGVDEFWTAQASDNKNPIKHILRPW